MARGSTTSTGTSWIISRADPNRHPELHRLGAKLAQLGETEWVELDWVRPTPEEMAARAMAIWTERVGRAVEDLHALPADRPTVAEGPRFFPWAVLPLAADPRTLPRR